MQSSLGRRGTHTVRRNALAVAAGILFIAGLPAQAQFYETSGSVYSDPTDLIPTFDRFVSLLDLTGNTLGVGGSAPGSFSALAGSLLKVDQISIANGGTGNGSLTVTGVGAKAEIGGTFNRLEIGNWGTGSMTVSAGALVDATVNAADCAAPGAWCHSFIGNAAGSTATLTVTGTGSEVRTLRAFVVGQGYVQTGFGTPGGTTHATLNVLDGGTLRTDGATVGAGPGGPDNLGSETVVANVTIDGPSSRWIISRNRVDNGAAILGAGIHANAQATITVSNGGRLLVDGTGSVGPFDGINLGNSGRADLTVTGVGSAVEISAANAFINVGRNGATGQGSFSVLAGATASTMFISVGRDSARGDLLIDGAGSQMTLSGVGTPGTAGTAGGSVGRDGGTGYATVSNGGRWLITDGGADSRPNVSSPNLVVGQGAAGTGSLTITGPGSTVEIVSTSLGLAAGIADNYNPYMRVGRDAGSTGNLLVSNGGKLLLTGNAKTSLTDQRYTSLVIGGREQNVAGGVGHATITGLGSEVRLAGTDAYVSVGRGPGGHGTLDVLNQGHLDSTGLDVGWTGGTGTMTVDNATVRLSGGPYVDGAGAGMTIAAGVGSVGAVALNNGARVSLSSDTASFGINVGGGRTLNGGTGTLAMAGGSAIEYSGTASHALSIGRNVGSTGSMTMTGGSSVLLGSNGFAFIGRVVGATGTMEVRDGSTLIADYVGIGSTPDVDTGTGALIVANSTVTATTVEIGALGTLGGSDGTINAMVINRGLLAPGESPGKIIINGGIRNLDAGRVVFDVEADGHGGFVTDELILTKGSTFDFGDMKVIFNFIGDTDPNLFLDTGRFDMDTFLRSRDGSTDLGLSSEFEPGTDWGTLFADTQFSAQADGFAVTDLTFHADGNFGVVAVPVPEPATWAMLFVGIALLTARARQPAAKA